MLSTLGVCVEMFRAENATIGLQHSGFFVSMACNRGERRLLHSSADLILTLACAHLLPPPETTRAATSASSLSGLLMLAYHKIWRDIPQARSHIHWYSIGVGSAWCLYFIGIFVDDVGFPPRTRREIRGRA